MMIGYRAGSILLDSNYMPFIYDGTKNADGYGCLIGYSEGKLCRSSGQGNFQKEDVRGYADGIQIAKLFNEIRNAKYIPFYSCI